MRASGATGVRGATVGERGHVRATRASAAKCGASAAECGRVRVSQASQAKKLGGAVRWGREVLLREPRGCRRQGHVHIVSRLGEVGVAINQFFAPVLRGASVVSFAAG